jgi:hypothetical protein
MFKTLIISFLCVLCITTSFAQQTKSRFTGCVGFGVNTLTNHLNEYFDPNILVFGVSQELAYKRHQITMDLMTSEFSNHYLLKSLDDQGRILPAGLKVKYDGIQFTYGFSILDHPKWRITPNGGLNIFRISNDGVSLKLDEVSAVAGLNIDYQFNTYPIKNKTKKVLLYSYTHGIRFRFSAAPVAFRPSLQGWQFVNMLSYCWTFGG